MNAPGPKEALALDCDAETFELIHQLEACYGPVVRIEASNHERPVWLLSDPDDIRRILVNQHRNYVKGVGFERVEMLLGNGIIVSDGAFWRRQRTMIQPAFSRGNMPRYFDMIKAVTLRLREQWRALAASGEPLDITTCMSEYALEIILRAIFSNDMERFFGAEEDHPFAFLTEDPTRNLMVAMKFRQLLKRVRALIAHRRETGERPFDLLSMMMDARASRTQEAMSDRELVDEVATMIIAGHETSAGTLNWAWYLMSSHAESRRLLRAESERVCPDGDLHYEQLSELTYTQQVLDETLRLYPPVWLFTRRALADDEIGGFSVAAGDNLFFSPYLVQHLPRFWDAPEAFKPERFSPDAQAPMQAFFPFSQGPRRCIGEFFSYVEMKTHLALMSREFRLRHIDDQPVRLEPAINLRTLHSINMTIEALDP
ncbi:MAG: cytochrome P450 [Xanthomonadales bacterium]|nr:cytochrome P450 [Xanthomonadales bacterium]